ncbi:hypothetical protein CSSP291_13455 [Cronobacter sakazakii SP291]|nr:hypothetical protein CSSP291_13455 [Cronobacter sakazakii SP291]
MPDKQAVYPRSCGEHLKRTNTDFYPTGLSPLVRGTQTTPFRRSPPSRLIPARAGNTRRSGKYSRPPAAYPRSCGEHSKTI